RVSRGRDAHGLHRSGVPGWVHRASAGRGRDARGRCGRGARDAGRRRRRANDGRRRAARRERAVAAGRAVEGGRVSRTLKIGEALVAVAGRAGAGRARTGTVLGPQTQVVAASWGEERAEIEAAPTSDGGLVFTRP